MPKLNQLECSIEIGRTNTELTAYDSRYGDKTLECYVAVPTDDVNFSIHLTSTGYIAPGLAMFVYIDGQYQCNRNRVGLVVPNNDTSTEEYLIDFRARQKEEKVGSEHFIGRDWSFSPLNIGSYYIPIGLIYEWC
jgi:hypothetical protein